MSLLKRLLMPLAVLAVTVSLSLLVASRLYQSSWGGRQIAQMSGGGLFVDGWLKERASVTIPGFSTLANVVEVTLGPLKSGPDGSPTATVSLCGQPGTQVQVPATESFAFSIPSGCSPLELAIESRDLQPLKEGASERQVSVQVHSIRVTSALGFPLLSVARTAEVFCSLAFLALCAFVAAGRIPVARWAAALIALGAAAAMVLLGTVETDKYLPLYIFVVALLAGIACTSLVGASQPEEAPAPTVWLFVVVAFGAAIRFYGIDFGLPANFHPDEVPKVNAIMRMASQDTWNPQYFLHPSLLLYSTYAMNSLLHVLGAEGTFRETAFLAGRLVSAVAGTLSIALTYALGRRLLSKNVGLLAAALLAVFPLHVTCSRYLKEDALLTFIVLSCALTTVIAVQSGRRWVLLVAGLLAGATAGTKYSGILLAVVPASAPWLASRSWKPDLSWLPWAALAVCVAPLGFLATTPYALLDSAKFLKDFASESRHMQTGHTNTIDPWSQLWMYHFYRSILPGMTPVLAVLSVMGLGLLVRRARIEDLFIVAVALLFYLPAEFVKAKPAPQPERYIVPCLPFLALAVAQLARAVGRRVSARHGLAICGAVILLAPLVRSVSLAADLRIDTRQQLAAWMRDNIPAGSKVLMDWKPYCPQLDATRFNVEHIERARIIPELDPSVLRDSGADYLILSSLFYARYFNQPESNPTLRQRIREVFESVPVVAQYQAPSGAYGFHNPVLTLFSLRREDFQRLDDERLRKRRGEIASTSNEARAKPRW